MKIAIAGYGLEGEQNYLYYSALGYDVTIVDEKELPDRPIPEGAKTLLGKGVFSSLEGYDQVIRTAGLSPKKIKTDGTIWSATNEFFEKSPAPIIGVTGTKGKGTTSSFIYEILKAARKDVYLVGNIGVSALKVLPKLTAKSIVVYELSSFQLWDIQKSPHIAVILGIEPDHLDVHSNLEDYISAKANIVHHQSESDIVVYKSTNETSVQISKLSPGIHFPYPNDMSDFKKSIMVPGAHNIENASAAIIATHEYVTDEATIKKGLKSYEGLPHRIKFVREVNGVSYYDDSYSSAPSAAIAAVKSFNNQKILFLGGYDKGADFSVLASVLAQTDSLKKIVLYGQTSQRIYSALKEARVLDDKIVIVESTNFSKIIGEAIQVAEPGDIVILSPACASFDMFKNFSERGDQFIDIIEAL